MTSKNPKMSRVIFLNFLGSSVIAFSTPLTLANVATTKKISQVLTKSLVKSVTSLLDISTTVVRNTDRHVSFAKIRVFT